jgi:hypothetical protein
VETGGKSFGNMRHWQPLEAMYRIASTTARKSVVRGRPPRLAAGSIGEIKAHSRAVKSLG